MRDDWTKGKPTSETAADPSPPTGTDPSLPRPEVREPQPRPEAGKPQPRRGQRMLIWAVVVLAMLVVTLIDQAIGNRHTLNEAARSITTVTARADSAMAELKLQRAENARQDSTIAKQQQSLVAVDQRSRQLSADLADVRTVTAGIQQQIITEQYVTPPELDSLKVDVRQWMAQSLAAWTDSLATTRRLTDEALTASDRRQAADVDALRAWSDARLSRVEKRQTLHLVLDGTLQILNLVRDSDFKRK